MSQAPSSAENPLKQEGSSLLAPAEPGAQDDPNAIPVVSPVPVAAFVFLVITLVLAVWRGESLSKWGDIIGIIGTALGAVYTGAFSLFGAIEALWANWVVNRSPQQRAQTREATQTAVRVVFRVYQALLITAAVVIAAGIIIARSDPGHGGDVIRIGGGLLGVPIAMLGILWLISTTAEEMETDDFASRRPIVLSDLHRSIQARHWRYHWPLCLAVAMIVAGLVIHYWT